MSGNFMDSLQQMMRDPPYMQSVMNPQAMDMFRQQMQQNPQLMQQIMESNPLVQSNPELSEQMRAQMPQLMNMLGRPEITLAMTNPRVLEAIQQIQQGTDTIRREAPELARTMFGLGTVPAASRQPAAAAQPQNTTTGTGNTTGAAPNAKPDGSHDEHDGNEPVWSWRSRRRSNSARCQSRGGLCRSARAARQHGIQQPRTEHCRSPVDVRGPECRRRASAQSVEVPY